jgi:Second Messenger Oligonucleotide or Dinucleotide Synthetase domain
LGYIDDAFANLKHNLEITQTEQDTAIRRHHNIRDYIKSRWDLEDDFLTGSYRRDTKTKKLKDIDIFIVIDKNGAQASYLTQPPGEVLNALEELLRNRWPDARRDGMAVVIHYGNDDDIMSIDVVPAADRKGGGYLIPNPGSGEWIATNPKRHHELSIAKNAECDGKFVPFVKMIKGINRELGEPVSPSFLLEVMAHSLVKAPFGRYQDEIVVFLATAAEQLDREWPDPAGLGGNVNSVMSLAQKLAAAAALRGAQETAERAVELEDDGQERAAYDEWKKLFGTRLTRP